MEGINKKYIKRGLKIGGTIGFLILIVQAVINSIGLNTFMRINYVPHFLTPLLVDLFNLKGENYAISYLFILLVLTITFYLLIGFIVAIVFAFFHHERKK